MTANLYGPIRDLGNRFSILSTPPAHNTATGAPSVVSVAIAANGTDLTITWNKSATIGSGGNGGFSLTGLTGGASTLTYSSGSGSTSFVYTISRTVEAGETGGELSYTQPGNGVEATVDGADATSFSGETVTNNSTQDSDPPQYLSSEVPASGGTLFVVFDENTTQGAAYSDSDWTLTASGGAVTLTYSSGDGTTTHIFTTSRTINEIETLTLAWAGTTNGLEDASGNDLASFSGEDVLNESIQDTIAPTISAAVVTNNGTTLTISSAEILSVGAGGNGGFTATMSGGAATLTYSSGDGTNSLVYTWSRTIGETETGTLNYTQPGNGIEDDAGNDLATFSSFDITQTATSLSVASAIIRDLISQEIIVDLAS